MFDLTGFQRDLLWMVASLEYPSGQEILEGFDKYGIPVTHSRLYPNLNTLSNKSLIEKSRRNQRTNCYEITTDGMRLLHERREWEESLVDLTDETSTDE